MTGPVNAHLTADLAKLPIGERALVVGGAGAEAEWLAERGWDVVAIQGDGSDWVTDQFGLVASVNMPVVGSTEDFVSKLASAVNSVGTLYIVGHLAPGQNQVSSDDAIAALSDDPWEIHIAEERERADGDGLDSVFYAENSGSF